MIWIDSIKNSKTRIATINIFILIPFIKIIIIVLFNYLISRFPINSLNSSGKYCVSNHSVVVAYLIECGALNINLIFQPLLSFKSIIKNCLSA
ncbi:MAG: hypothetical protein CMF23_12375 [Ignavibacteriae bacterium]|nr:hypothetical protein [Ignavibacteriota bacterium]